MKIVLFFFSSSPLFESNDECGALCLWMFSVHIFGSFFSFSCALGSFTAFLSVDFVDTNLINVSLLNLNPCGGCYYI